MADSKNRWLIPIGAVAVHICIGSVYAWSTFNRPIQVLFPSEPWWFGLTDDELASVYPWEDWVLAASHVGFPLPGEPEDDLFSGIRHRVTQ